MNNYKNKRLSEISKELGRLQDILDGRRTQKGGHEKQRRDELLAEYYRLEDNIFCPYCSSPDITLNQDHDYILGVFVYYLSCDDCSARGPTTHKENEVIF